MKQVNMWYDKTKLLSFHAFFNMIVGNRGGGKTYCFKTWSIDDFLKTGHQFIWIRRYGEEIKKMKKSFFKDIKDKYPEHEFDVHGDAQFGTFYIDKKVMGYYVSLSTSANLKSTSFPQVDKIVFDEFLIIGNTYHYLSDEVVLLMELIETVFRMREFDDHAVKPRGVYLLGNNITSANPYYLYYGIKPFTGDFYRDKERGIVVQQYKNSKYVAMKKQSAIGKLTEGTTYAEYSIENKSFLDDDRFIRAHKPPRCAFNCAIVYKSRTFGFWLDYEQGDMYVNYQYDPSSPRIYCLTKDDHTVNTFLIKNLNNTFIKNIVWMFRNGCMYFQDHQVKNQVFEALSYFIK